MLNFANIRTNENFDFKQNLQYCNLSFAFFDVALGQGRPGRLYGRSASSSSFVNNNCSVLIVFDTVFSVWHKLQFTQRAFPGYFVCLN